MFAAEYSAAAVDAVAAVVLNSAAIEWTGTFSAAPVVFVFVVPAAVFRVARLSFYSCVSPIDRACSVLSEI